MISLKKLLFILSIFLLSIYPVFASEDKYEEKVYSLDLDNFNSKDINEVFEGIKYNIIEIEIQTSRLTKSYRFNLSIVNNLEEELNKLVIDDLRDILSIEDISILEVNGFKISKIVLRCTKIDKDIILERVS